MRDGASARDDADVGLFACRAEQLRIAGGVEMPARLDRLPRRRLTRRAGAALLGGGGGEAEILERDAETSRPRTRPVLDERQRRSEEHTSELQSLMRISYAVFCLKTKTHINRTQNTSSTTIHEQ